MTFRAAPVSRTTASLSQTSRLSTREATIKATKRWPRELLASWVTSRALSLEATVPGSGWWGSTSTNCQGTNWPTCPSSAGNASQSRQNIEPLTLWSARRKTWTTSSTSWSIHFKQLTASPSQAKLWSKQRSRLSFSSNSTSSVAWPTTKETNTRTK